MARRNTLWMTRLPQSQRFHPQLIRGNVPIVEKQLQANIFSFFADQEGQSYGAAVARRIEFVETDIREVEGGGLKADVTFKVDVDDDMANVFRVLHGACTAYMIDVCSSIALSSLCVHLDVDAAALSQEMNIIWHAPALVGAELTIIATSLAYEGRISTSRCEIWDKSKEMLLCSAVHKKKGRGSKAAGPSQKL